MNQTRKNENLSGNQQKKYPEKWTGKWNILTCLMPYHLCCPIDHCVMRDPVVLSDGHSYDRPNIVRWLATNFTSPMTGRILADRKLSPNINLQNAIREWLETRTEKEREDAARHEREAEEAARVEDEKARQVSTTRAREADDAARVASIEAEAAARVESL